MTSMGNSNSKEFNALSGLHRLRHMQEADVPAGKPLIHIKQNKQIFKKIIPGPRPCYKPTTLRAFQAPPPEGAAQSSLGSVSRVCQAQAAAQREEGKTHLSGHIISRGGLLYPGALHDTSSVQASVVAPKELEKGQRERQKKGREW